MSSALPANAREINEAIQVIRRYDAKNIYLFLKARLEWYLDIMRKNKLQVYYMPPEDYTQVQTLIFAARRVDNCRQNHVVDCRRRGGLDY